MQPIQFEVFWEKFIQVHFNCREIGWKYFLRTQLSIFHSSDKVFSQSSIASSLAVEFTGLNI